MMKLDRPSCMTTLPMTFLVALFAACDQVKPTLSPEAAKARTLPSQGGEANPRQAGNDRPAVDPFASPAVLSSDNGITAPQTDAATDAAETQVRDRSEFMNRPFATIRPIESDNPADLVAHLAKIDDAIRDLVIAGSNNIIEKQLFINFGMRLGKMKLETGQSLANLSSASSQQRKSGVLATIIALSHMSGLGDVQSAKELESLARGLMDSEDSDLAHQSRVVLLGFELQSLQNGLKTDTSELLQQVHGLFERPEDRGFPEFMMAQQAIHVLSQLGFQNDADKMTDILVEQYEDSPDPELRSQVWAFKAGESQALSNYNQALAALGAQDFQPQDVSAAARGLFAAFPTAQTLEQLARSIANIEYSGFVDLSDELSRFIKQSMEEFDSSAAFTEAAGLIAKHDARLALIGKPLDLESLVDLDGNPIRWSQYEGKVVLVDFWATWCVPCLREIPHIRELYKEFGATGFDVVAVNMDDSAENAKEFITKQELPWTNYRFSGAAGFQSEFAIRNGLNMIPFLLLVNREGRVVQIHVRGNKLATAVRRELGLETELIP